MKIIEENRGKIKMEKKLNSLFGVSISFFIFAVIGILMYFLDNQDYNFLSRSLIFSYFSILLSIFFLLFSGKKIITFSKTTNELVIETNRIIKKSKKKYLLNEIDYIIKRNKIVFRRIYGSSRLLKVAKYYLRLKNGTSISLFSYELSSTYSIFNKKSSEEKDLVLKNLDTISKFLNIHIKE